MTARVVPEGYTPASSDASHCDQGEAPQVYEDNAHERNQCRTLVGHIELP
jgi:hypothetical protein